MTRFSQRMGHTPVREVIQREQVDDATRNRLWDVAWSCLPSEEGLIRYHHERAFYYALWIDFFEKPADAIPEYASAIHSELRSGFFRGSWYEMYDILEYVLRESEARKPKALKFANEVLEDFLCGYRFVGTELVELSDEQEIRTIETALEHPLTGVRAHFQKALTLLGSRTNPDPPNSIKESVSAVESICSAIVGRKATLGEALKALEKAGIHLHPALKDGWLKTYGWTSDEGGIRHAMQEESKVDKEDALYMLVSCSAFVALLTEKARKSGIELAAAK